ncbi:MAG: penicillin acylase family protein, partial [Elioraea sp.]|nr:penicillin acylase family protein [Elioraea sp.]
LAEALEQAIESLRERFGTRPISAWRWGEAHVAGFAHPLLRFVPGLGPRFGARMETPGDGETVLRAGFRGAGRAAFENVHGPVFRAVYDLADLDRSLFVVAPGQSGHPASPHFRDLASLWLAGGTLTIPPEPSAVAGRLRLVPEAGGR